MLRKLLPFVAVAVMALVTAPVLFWTRTTFDLGKVGGWQSRIGFVVWLLTSATLVVTAALVAMRLAPASGCLYGGAGVILYAAALTLVDEGIEWSGYRLGLAAPMLGVLAAAVALRTSRLGRAEASPFVYLGGGTAILWVAVTVWAFLFLE
jgi:hypothetical protein